MRLFTLSRAAIAVLLVASTGCSSKQAPPGAQGFPPAAVQLTTASTSNVEDATEFVATLKSLHSTTIQPQIDGQITQIFVKSGDRVALGAAARPDRPAPPAGGGVEPGSRARGDRSQRRLRARAGAARERALRRRRDQQAGTGAGRHGAQDRRSEPQGAAGAGPAAAGAAALLHHRRADGRRRRRRSGRGRACRSRRPRC